jgi:hypothetical protein
MIIKGKGVPVGRYSAVFEGVKETHHAEYGPGLFWRFSIDGGEFDGSETGRTTSAAATRKNACGAIYKAITGRPFSPSEKVDVDAFIGRKYRIKVDETENGATRVVDADLIDGPAAPPPVSPPSLPQQSARGANPDYSRNGK